ncbi:polygalacturonase-like isoform X2 [Diospyros lotus]|uniref:polygalacturonase-like isoform X2 n=1 Tax=Diospyros lotus TaxID=55363 RepID=UPI002256817F|nr:polygalacturonase-like isoform X2 [Diospyros lotus]
MYAMAPQRYIFACLLVIFLSFLSCYSTSPEDPAQNHHLQASASSEAYFQNKIRRLLASVKTVSVDDFGAKGDGSDDTQAFKNAWQAACSSSAAATLLVPKKKYLVKPIRFAGPCKAVLTVQIYGTIEASANRADYKEDGTHWLLFDSVQNLQVQGGGTIDGNGNTWWENSCKINKALALTFYNCKNIIVKNLKIQQAQQIHLSFEKSTNVQASSLTVTSPQTSPNTDGIHITDTQNIQISSCVIGTGDDCISIVSGSQKVKATDITCGPGHGISIGSLGSGNSKAFVSDVLVNGAKLYGTQNGLRIKTWQGGSGSVSNIKFLNVRMNNVDNPIIIDQSYCDQDKPCKGQGSAVQVKDVLYQNIQGTSASEVAISFSCSKDFPCEGIVLQSVNIKREGVAAAAAKASCTNVKLSETGAVAPHCP